jgi:hypothetical protein
MEINQQIKTALIGGSTTPVGEICAMENSADPEANSVLH